MIHTTLLFTLLITSCLSVQCMERKEDGNWLAKYCVDQILNIAVTTANIGGSGVRAIQTRVDQTLQEQMLGFSSNTKEGYKTAQTLHKIENDLKACTYEELKIYSKRSAALVFAAHKYLQDNIPPLKQHQSIKGALELLQDHIPHPIRRQLEQKQMELQLQLSELLENKNNKYIYPKIGKIEKDTNALDHEQIAKFIHDNNIHESEEYKKRIAVLQQQINMEFFLKTFSKK